MLSMIRNASARAVRAALPTLAEGTTYVASPFAAFTTVASIAGGPGTVLGRVAGYAAVGAFIHFEGPKTLSQEAKKATSYLCDQWNSYDQKKLADRKAREQEYIDIAYSKTFPKKANTPG